MTTRQAADYIGVCYRTMFNYIEAGAIPYAKPAGRYYFRRSDLDAFMVNGLK